MIDIVINQAFTYSWVSANIKIVVAKMALHPELIDRSCVVHANFLLFGVVP